MKNELRDDLERRKLPQRSGTSADAESGSANVLRTNHQNPDLSWSFTGQSGQGSLAFEPFVDPDAVADFLYVKRKTILDWARAGIIPAHQFGRGKRVVWRFRISEIASHKKPVPGKIGTGSPEIARTDNSNG